MLTDEMQDLGMDSREAMSSAALTAGWRFWGVDDREVHAQPETSSRSDAIRCATGNPGVAGARGGTV